jgi:hypothetical protein
MGGDRPRLNFESHIAALGQVFVADRNAAAEFDGGFIHLRSRSYRKATAFGGMTNKGSADFNVSGVEFHYCAGEELGAGRGGRRWHSRYCGRGDGLNGC